MFKSNPYTHELFESQSCSVRRNRNDGGVNSKSSCIIILAGDGWMISSELNMCWHHVQHEGCKINFLTLSHGPYIIPAQAEIKSFYIIFIITTFIFNVVVSIVTSKQEGSRFDPLVDHKLFCVEFAWFCWACCIYLLFLTTCLAGQEELYG